jgi:cystathionine beta-lyase/cystathionine gamma-synthase
LSPQDTFLLERGLKTLYPRVTFQNQSALEIAQFLEAHSKVRRVYYPGLKSHPDYEAGRKYFKSGGFGSVLSFELKSDVEGAKKLIPSLRLPVETASFGGIEALICRPVTTSHAPVDSATRLKMGVTDGLIRLSVGMESTEDLIQDLEQGLSRL